MTVHPKVLASHHPADALPGTHPLEGAAPRTVHWVRHGMYSALRDTLAARRPTGHGITISDRDPVLPFLCPDADLRVLDYPTHDLQDLQHFASGSLDLVMADMVLEHVDEPAKVFDSAWRVLRPGGLLVLTTVFCMVYHPCPNDHWRFSRTGLERLATGFSEIETGGFGNRRLFSVIMGRLTRLPVPLHRPSLPALLTAGDNPKLPITTWVVARK